MTNLMIYSKEDQALVDDFRRLPEDQQIGYWDRTHEGELSNLKERIKSHYILSQNYSCPYCRQRIEVDHKAVWDVEHVIPKSSHPKFMFDELNLCVSCKDCNIEKSEKNVLVNKRRKTIPEGSGDYLIVHPHLDKYDENIKIISIASFYLPITLKGRRTVEICGLLRFLYKVANIEYGDDAIDARLGELQEALMAAQDEPQKFFILSCISHVASEAVNARMKMVMKNGVMN